LPSASAPWAPPNNKKTSPVVTRQQMACASAPRSCQFNEYFNCLPKTALRSKRNRRTTVPSRKKKSCSIVRRHALLSRAARQGFQTNQACGTEACGPSLRALSTGPLSDLGSGPSLDQRGWHVYSPIIRTGRSPPSQLSTLDLVIARKGFSLSPIGGAWKSCGTLMRNLLVVVVCGLNSHYLL
jgi:hypothetical protein